MNKILKRLLGIDKAEKAKEEAERAQAELKKEKEKFEKAKKPVVEKTPKEIATEKKEPWVAVMDTHVNKDNIRNGFFELDWNEYFVLQLRTNGYQGENDEAVVDLWFQDLCRNIGSEAGVNMERRGSGFINVNNLGDGKSEVF